VVTIVGDAQQRKKLTATIAHKNNVGDNDKEKLTVTIAPWYCRRPSTLLARVSDNSRKSRP
jgi:hypothetical protein